MHEGKARVCQVVAAPGQGITARERERESGVRPFLLSAHVSLQNVCIFEMLLAHVTVVAR